jgi:hypothetical protein
MERGAFRRNPSARSVSLLLQAGFPIHYDDDWSRTGSEDLICNDEEMLARNVIVVWRKRR